MQVLFVHQNFPAQFGHVAGHLARELGWDCVFVSQVPPGEAGGVRRIQYRPKGGAREVNHHCSRTFENAIWHAHGVFEVCKASDDLRPDLIVGHSGFGSTVFLPELYPGVPVVNYFEYYYHPHDSDMDFRPDFPPRQIDLLRARARNAMILLDLVNCRGGYSPTSYQRDLFPAELRPKIEVIPDGIDTGIFSRRPGVKRRIGGRDIPEATRIVTYVSRGFESMRGFDIFMRVAKLVYLRHPDVLFVVAGRDTVHYGGDTRHIRGTSFREHVFAQDSYDESKFLFVGLVPVDTLVDILSLSDLHIYLTVPFVLSWSLMNALACGCVVLASKTAPVLELIDHGETGLLADFFDVEGLAEEALKVLADPSSHAELGRRGADLIRERYALDQAVPRLVGLFQAALSG